jgi:alkylation response protein AidB-like acyl-CoA dehydrogenase
MPTYRAPLDDFRFLIHEYLKLQDYAGVSGFEGAAELAMPLLEEGAKFCESVLFPLNATGDAEGCHYVDGVVTMPKGFKQAYARYVEGGWPTFTCDPAYGGQGLPEVLNMPMTEMICSANLSFGLTPGLSHSAYALLSAYLTDDMKARYLPKLISGKWTGVMCLTEPQAGTDLGLIRTTATPVLTEGKTEQGEARSGGGAIAGVKTPTEYTLDGTKIFISSGEHDLSENILHLVLARLPNAPAGVKGISLFLTSKYHVDEYGLLAERNAVTCAGIEHKMGIHASSTCVMQYDGARAYLVGEPHKGLRAMFMMMNSARLYVGVQGLGVGEVAMQNAVAYAAERLQGRALTGAVAPTKPADPITVHPDVRKMLLTMRAFTEAARALVLEVALHHDLSHRHTDAGVRKQSDAFVQLMTPITKAVLTDGGHETAHLAMQCFGGYGYIREYGIEQYARDARIAMIYEGTNGVQAMDLVGRKLPYHTGEYLSSFFHPVQEFIDAHAGDGEMREFIAPLAKHVEYLRKATLWLGKEGMTNPNSAAAGATEYLKMFGLVMFAFIWARQAKLALNAIAESRANQLHHEKLMTARFFMARLLPQTLSLFAVLTAGGETLYESMTHR